MTTWATTTYARTAEGQLVQAHRTLTPAELPSAVYAVEASDDGGRTYASNGLRWLYPEPACTWANDLALRWFGCTNIRVVRVTPPEVCDYHADSPGWDTCSEDRPCVRTYTVVEVIDQTL